MPETAIPRWISQVANIDIGLDIFRDWLPAHGFKLVVPPPAAGGIARAFASIWRRGTGQAISHTGMTASLALLRAAETEFRELHGTSVAAACGRCRGLGWFVTNDATVEICRHADAIQFPAA